MLRLFAVISCVLCLLAAVAGSAVLVLTWDRLAQRDLVPIELATLAAVVLAALLAPALPRPGASWADRLRAVLPFGAAMLCVAAVVIYVDVRARAHVRVRNAYADWHQYRSRHFLFVYPPNSAVADDIGRRAHAADRGLERIVAFFGLSFDRRLVAYIHQDVERAIAVLERPPPLADAERHEVHLLAGSSAVRWAALVAAETAWDGPAGSALLREGVPTYLASEASQWPAALSYVKGDLPQLEELVSDADQRRGGDTLAASFVAFLVDAGGREALGKLWPSPTFRGTVYQTYGKRADELEAEWHDHLAGLLGFESAGDLEATVSSEVPLDSEVAEPVVELVQHLRDAAVGGRLDQAEAVLADEASSGAREVLRTLVEKQVDNIELIALTDYGGKCLLADLHVSTEVNGRPFEMDADAVVSLADDPTVLHLAFR
ncbi:MAG: hypothetical protein ACE5R4_08020 [Armatimonadota bacterium]